MPETSAKVAIAVAAVSAVGAIVVAYITAPSKPEPPQPPDPSNTMTMTTQRAVTQGVPGEYQGTWSGSFTVAIGGTTLTEQLIYQIGPGRAGEVVGTFQQPQCAGRIVYESGTGPIEFTDQATSNPNNFCAESTRARAVLVDSKTLSVTLFSGNVVVGQAIVGKG